MCFSGIFLKIGSSRDTRFYQVRIFLKICTHLLSLFFGFTEQKLKKRPPVRSKIWIFTLKWCAGRDLNPQALFRQQILSLSCIPIPPPAHLQWRRVRDSHSCNRFCRPMPNSSANAPDKIIMMIISKINLVILKIEKF